MNKLIITAASHVGCIRSNNEDMILVWDHFVRNGSFCTAIHPESIGRFALALADGMGGHNAGEVASEETLSNLHFFLNDMPAGLTVSDMNEMMVEWLNSINNIIESRGLNNPSMSEMGTTLVGIIYYEGRYYWINCGDSRLYRFRDGHLTQITTDHSLNNMTGTTKHSNIITNCIGAGCRSSFLDMYEFTNDVLAGDTYIICSDGLNDMVPDPMIESLATHGCIANDYCQAAVEAGGYDNVSVCVVKVE